MCVNHSNNIISNTISSNIPNVQSSEPTEEKEEAPVKEESAADEQNNSRRGRPALHNKVIRFCTMADDDKVTKIRTIAAREGIAIKDLMNLAFDKIINEYERKYGTVRLPKVKKGGDVSKVFDLS